MLRRVALVKNDVSEVTKPPIKTGARKGGKEKKQT
jgi:hypothetical protein